MKLSLTNPRFISITYFILNKLLVILALLAIVIILFYPYKRFATGNVLVDVEVNLQKQGFNSIVKSSDSNYYYLSEPKGMLTIAPQNIWIYILANSKDILLFIASFIVVFELRKIVKSIKEEDVFTTDKSRIFRVVAIIVIILPPLVALHKALLFHYLPDDLIINGFRVLKPSLDIKPVIHGVIWGVILLGLSDVFKQGRKIQEEVELTV